MCFQNTVLCCFIITLIAFEFFRRVNIFDMIIETVLTIASEVTFMAFEGFLTVVCCNMLCQLEF